jgi:hypothetical protein
MKAYVTLSGSMVAVATTEDKALQQVNSMLNAASETLVFKAREFGEHKMSVAIRVCNVEVNQ